MSNTPTYQAYRPPSYNSPDSTPSTKLPTHSIASPVSDLGAGNFSGSQHSGIMNSPVSELGTYEAGFMPVELHGGGTIQQQGHIGPHEKEVGYPGTAK